MNFSKIWIGLYFISLVYIPDSIGLSFTAKPKGKNIAIVIASPGRGKNSLPGVSHDYDRMKRLFAYKPFSLEVKGLWNPSQERVEQDVEQAAKDADSEGTVVVYFSGHGDSDGDFIIDGKWMDFRSFLRAIRDGREALEKRTKKFTPLKRLVVIADSCYSGQLTGGEEAAWRKLYDMKPRAVEQLIILAATQSDETAIDDGKSLMKAMRGGRYSVAFSMITHIHLVDGVEGGNLTFKELNEDLRTTIGLVHTSRWNLYGLLGSKHTPTWDFTPNHLKNANVFPIEIKQKKCLTLIEQKRYAELYKLAQAQNWAEFHGFTPNRPLELDEMTEFYSLMTRKNKYGNCR